MSIRRTKIAQQPNNLQHDVQVIFGTLACNAYDEGERCIDVLTEIGRVRVFSFGSPEESAAFIRGVEATEGHLHTLTADDLIPSSLVLN